MSDDNGAAFAELDRMIRVCRSLDATMVEQATPAVAEQLRTVVAECVAAGRSPEGEAWKPTKAGTPALRGAMEAVDVKPDSTGVTATLEGYHVFHQRGTHSQGANRAAKKAASARKASRGAAKEARHANKKAERAAAKAATAPTERRKKTWTKKAADAAAAAKVPALKAKGAAFHAESLSAGAASLAGVGGLPARRIIPQNMPMNLSEQLRTLFRERYESHMRGDE